MSLVLSIAIGVSLLMLAFFGGLEAAFATANRLSIELKKKQGFSSGVLLSRLLEEPSRYIGTVIVGFTFFLVIFVLLVSTLWNTLLNRIEMAYSLITPVRSVLEILFSFVAVVFFHFIFRSMFRAKSDSLLSFSAKSGLLGIFHDLFYPIASGFIKMSAWILHIIFDMRIDKKKELLSRGDLEHFYQQSREYHDENQDVNTELFEAALSLHKVKVRECLIPRKEIEAVDLNASIEDVRNKLVETRLSKLIVFDGNIDHIIGYIHHLDLFKKPAFVKDILLPIPAIPESMSATDLISKFTKEQKSIAWVVDEFGGTSGIVTMEDILEEIFGEIKDEYDVEEFEEKQVSDTEYVLSGRLELDYLREKYGLEFEENTSETLSGFIIHQYEKIPKLKERIFIDNYEFEILHVTDTRIEMVRVKVLS